MCEQAATAGRPLRAPGYFTRSRELIITNLIDNSPGSLQGVSPAAARAIPFAVFIAFIMLQAMVGERLLAAGLDTRWLYAARVCTVAALLLVFWRHYTEMHDFAGVTARRLAIALTAGMAVFLLWINLDFEWARLGHSPGFDPTSPGGSGVASEFVIFRLLGLAIVVPVMEELFWRSFLLRWLERNDFMLQDPAKVGLRAMLICAGLFALEHNLWLAGFIAGMVYVLLYVFLGGSIWLPIVSHATTNAALGWWILATRSWQFW
ncbi:MAG: CAAX prenyl protease-related protein [Burkholderiales bacterium]